MTFHTWGFIYLGTGSENPAVDRAVIERGGLTTTVVGWVSSSPHPGWVVRAAAPA